MKFFLMMNLLSSNSNFSIVYWEQKPKHFGLILLSAPLQIETEWNSQSCIFWVQPEMHELAFQNMKRRQQSTLILSRTRTHY